MLHSSHRYAIRKQHKELSVTMERKKSLDAAIDKTIDNIPNDFIIKPYLMAHRAEVKGMLLTEYNEAEAMELFKEEGRQQGRVEGRAEGRAEGEDRFARLMNKLFSLKRFSDAEKAADIDFREKMFDEFQIA